MFNIERSLRADVPKLKSFDLADHCVYRLGLFSTARRGRQRLLTIEGQQRVCSSAKRKAMDLVDQKKQPAFLAFRLTGAQL
ncbi:Transcription initiation factor TFIID subunit [Trichinella pseudospiralis]